MVYDCHGKSHSFVKEDFENWLLVNQFEAPLEVITGNSEHMQRIVKGILDFYDFKYYIPPTNQGTIRVI